MTVFLWVNYKTYALFFTYFCSIGSWIKDRFPVIQLIAWGKYSCFIIQPLSSYSIASKLDDGVTLMGGGAGFLLEVCHSLAQVIPAPGVDPRRVHLVRRQVAGFHGFGVGSLNWNKT